jgi:sigma-B regulation protein RsbU (phosphoserine phosphatase)
MNFRDHFPIKWKLSLALIATGLSLVLIYVVIANRVFESDKISYVFESQSSMLNSLRREIDGRLEQALLSSQSLLATLDATGKMPIAAQNLFKNNKSLLAIELWDETASKSIFKTEKTAGGLPVGGSSSEKVAPGEIKVSKTADQNFILVFRPYQESGTLILARVLVDAHDFLPASESRQPLLLVQNAELVASAGVLSFEPPLVPSLVQKFARENAEKTSLWQVNGHRFLISTANLSFGDLKILAFTPEEEALGALRTLFYRSIVFVAFSTFGLIIISLLLSKTLTSNLEILTFAATEIGQGHFDKTPVIKSKDEMGVLSRAFIKMSQEIKRLLIETRDKARMESELKTAKLVQESLLPAKASFEFGELEINGLVLNSTECG